MKVWSLVVLSNRSAFHWWSAWSATLLLLLSRWTDVLLCGGYAWVPRLEIPCVPTRWTGERWVEQIFRLHVVFHRDGCWLFRLGVPQMQGRFGFVLKSCFVNYFLCLNSIFHLMFLLQYEVTFFPLFDTQNRFCLHTWSADEATAALTTCHPTFASAMHSWIFQNKTIQVNKGILSILICRGPPTLIGRTFKHGRLGVGRIFSMGALGDFPKIFLGWGQKWWNLFFTTRNHENNLFLLKFSKSKGGPRLPTAPISDVHTFKSCAFVLTKGAQRWLTRWPPWSFINPMCNSDNLCLHWSAGLPLCFH